MTAPRKRLLRPPPSSASNRENSSSLLRFEIFLEKLHSFKKKKIDKSYFFFKLEVLTKKIFIGSFYMKLEFFRTALDSSWCVLSPRWCPRCSVCCWKASPPRRSTNSPRTSASPSVQPLSLMRFDFFTFCKNQKCLTFHWENIFYILWRSHFFLAFLWPSKIISVLFVLQFWVRIF